MDLNAPLWRKSTRSGGNGGDCVELADLTPWRKSTRSGGTGGQCVEIADLSAVIGIRDSKAPAAGHLAVSRRALTVLITRVKAGHLNL